MEAFENRSPLEAKKKAIEEIESFDLKNIDQNKIKELVKIIFSGFSFTGILMHGNWVLYRGIKYSNKPTKFSDIIYPPVEKAVIKRANYSGEQMFYCTTNKKVIFYELDIKPGDTLVISTWVTSESLLLNPIGYTEKSLRKLNSSDSTPLFKPGSDKYDDEENQFIHDYLSKTFSQPITDISTYNITIPISKFLLSEINENAFINKIKADGIFYPTIRFDANGNNIVFLPRVIDEKKIVLDRVEFIELVALENEKYVYKIKDIVQSVNGEDLVWENLQNTWTVTDEDGDLFFVDGEAFNEDGDRIIFD